ncbi:MAG: type II toxin-antitoxin system HicB family antitoxin [Oscillospiraceae bacterium]|nr:type II toxin-antitoxin system HicB family antitoxin [Oscillospiraceae bacterium]
MAAGNLLYYKGYSARPEYSADDRTFYGVILGISDLVDFSSDRADELENEFHRAVDDYLDFCREIGKEPQKEYKGTFNVRVSPELHRQAAMRAEAENVSLNRFVENALRNALVHS